jgi:hypothetical protein
MLLCIVKLTEVLLCEELGKFCLLFCCYRFMEYLPEGCGWELFQFIEFTGKLIANIVEFW